ncbi:hypothetical protein EBBID32_11520 [Sphingobium indicum BiD32]|uniref:Uncharacterized protein n=1 Tax=Sphingobium indicum BiD32 TaxID=1301087 RepID=N1MJ65_9SPHN|nr:hypothetical protein EBBID32_11520 [Sphingobium indicum BiD32]
MFEWPSIVQRRRPEALFMPFIIILLVDMTDPLDLPSRILPLSPARRHA